MQIPSIEKIKDICNRTGKQSMKQARIIRAFLEALEAEDLSIEDAFDTAQDVERVVQYMHSEELE